MGEGHGEKAAVGSGTAAARHSGGLKWALAMTSTFMVVEVVGGLWTGSLALLADAAHMLTDVGGMLLALVAIRFAARPATPEKTFGYVRMEVLSALANAVVLLFLTIYILYEAWQRFLAPPEILGGPMLAVAVVGLAVNLVSMKMLHAGSRESLNLKGAYFEVLADMLGSVGVILAAAVVLLTGWTLADPIIGAGIGLFIVPRTWILLKGAVHILMEGTPPEVDVGLLERQLMDLPGVTAVHDLHVWTLTSGLDALSCHLVVEDMARGRQALLAAQQTMEKSFGITHCTIQIEDADLRMDESDAH
ncbi:MULTISPECIES: cation diffusion facilitator family transporter [Marinobacter]|jgi:cobalt-zinc-cadmium efflux system protein|uniref:Cation transporter n=1 Tax=Marinobacter salarius TaxID=1420917 RepID=W5YSB0_9GAMM|nr:MULTISPECIES: cation diffusion facilitator family transporter [Marinobacter]AHI32011.1 cation transporter [Marinobacter salarius]MAB53061.1 cation transporter [Marinobacter sp.]MBE93539.1 cation transporter [Marinobacter sp.]MBJ7278632.1 cation transporter [Marinobacter salarius]WOI18546.1 cation diffusion facilitator family transporter [Marinobacter salarius]|tara:strand:+ start:1265 stop:2179 length:915 start_codon:yes stop_codon:yes gene_type:complete